MIRGRNFKMATNQKTQPGLLLICLFIVIVCSTALFDFGSDSEPSVCEILPKYGLPSYLLPDSITSYSISDDGSFVVELQNPCYIHFDYLVYYERWVPSWISMVFRSSGCSSGSMLMEINVDLPTDLDLGFNIGGEEPKQIWPPPPSATIADPPLHLWPPAPSANAGTRSRLMLTMRIIEVAFVSQVQTHGMEYSLDALSQEESWVLFEKKAFPGSYRWPHHLKGNFCEHLHVTNRYLIESSQWKGYACAPNKSLWASTEPYSTPTISVHFKGVHYLLYREMTWCFILNVLGISTPIVVPCS